MTTIQNRQYCTFLVGGSLCGIDVRDIQEVIRAQPMTPVPLAGEAVRGLINLRGQIVTAVDMRGRLGLPGSDMTAPVNVVVRQEEGPVSLLVDAIDDVVEVADEPAPPPPTVPPAGRRLITGVHQMADRLLLVIDASRAVTG